MQECSNVIHTYTYACTRTHTYVRTHKHTQIHTYIYTYIYTHIHTHTHTHTHTHAHTHTQHAHNTHNTHTSTQHTHIRNKVISLKDPMIIILIQKLFTAENDEMNDTAISELAAVWIFCILLGIGWSEY